MSWQQPKFSYTLWISCKGKLISAAACTLPPILPYLHGSVHFKNGELVSQSVLLNLWIWIMEPMWRKSSHECCGTFPNVRTARASGLCWMSIPVVWTCQMMRSVGKHVQNNKIMLDFKYHHSDTSFKSSSIYDFSRSTPLNSKKHVTWS